MPLKLKLTHKALILVIVPLIFEIGFVTRLYGLLKQAQHDQQLATHAQIVIEHVHKLLELLVDSTTEAAGEALGRDLPATKAGRSEALFAEFDKVSELLNDEPEKQMLLVLTRNYFKVEVVEVEAIRNLSDKGYHADALRRLNQLQTRIRQSNALLKQLIVSEESIYSQSDAVQARSRAVLDQSLALGLVTNIIIAFGLALYFNKGTIKRLNVLMDNAQRLGRSETLNPTLSGGDEIGHLDQVFHDVDQALREAESRKQELIAMVTHDLRAPLTSIQGVFTLLTSGAYGELSDKGRSGVERAERSTDRLITLINDLLDIEKIKAGKLELNQQNMLLLPIIKRSVDAVQQTADAQKITIESPRDDVEVFADGDRIVQVLVNLLSNALKFSPADSTIKISIFKSPAFAELRVSDQGSGIPDRYKEVIFEQFQQIDEKTQQRKPDGMRGTGLGLSISTEIIKQHGGVIGLESEEGKGSTFWFRLKRAKKPEIEAPNSDS